MRQAQHEFVLSTPGRGAHEFTEQVVSWVEGTSVASGLLTLFVRHTSASLLVMENASPVVMEDLFRFLSRLVPDGDPLFFHTDEGPDDMPAHVRSALTLTSVSIPVTGGALVLGTWQGIWLLEHRLRPHRRLVAAHLMGE